MRNKSTLIFAIVVLALGAYTFWDYRHSLEQGSLEQGERKAFPFKPDEVDSIKLHRADQDIELKRTGPGAWQMVKPVQDAAEAAAVDGYVYSLIAQRIRLFHTDDAPASKDWKTFGLDQPAATIELSAKGKAWSLIIGSKNAFDGSFYVRQGDDILLGETGLAQLKDRLASSFRSRRIWREAGAMAGAEVTDLESGEAFKVVKQGESWTLEPKPSFAVSQDKLSAWMEHLESFTPADIAKDGISEEDKREFLLLKPSYIIKSGDWQLTIGQDKAEDVYLYTNKREAVLKTTKSALAEIRVPTKFFREGKSPFSFPLEQVRRVEIHTAEVHQVFKKSDSAWTLEPQTTEKELDQDKLVTLIQAVHDLEALEYPKEHAAGVKEPQLILRDDKGAALFTLAWGDEFKAKEPFNKGRGLRFAKTNIDAQVLGVSKEKLDKLVDPSIIRVKKKDKGPKK